MKDIRKILFVFGTRPEVIKMAPVIECARKFGKGLDSITCITAQHRYLLDQALAEFNIKPDIDLNLMRPNQTLQDITASVMRAMRKVYQKVQPDLVLVQGDTSTVFAASLVTYYENINLGHIEAGLRSGDNRNPFPEEINRRFVSLVARYNFCPTAFSKNNLLSEAVDSKKIFVTGNTVIDALKKILERTRKKRPVIEGLDPEFLTRPYVLLTGHRRENFGKGLEDICAGVRALAIKHKSLNWVWAVHLNPNVRKVVFRILSDLVNVRIIEPPGYSLFVYLLDNCEFVVSDSGGVQEEASYLKKKVLVTRVCTERPEAVKTGTSILIGTEPENMHRCVNILLNQKIRPQKKGCPFGDGLAAKRIIDVITKGHCKEFKSCLS